MTEIELRVTSLFEGRGLAPSWRTSSAELLAHLVSTRGSARPRANLDARVERLCDEGVLDRLMGTASEPEHELLIDIAGELGGPATTRVLFRRFLDDEQTSAVLRAAAIRALVTLGGTEGAEELLRVVEESRDREERFSALAGIRNIASVGRGDTDDVGNVTPDLDAIERWTWLSQAPISLGNLAKLGFLSRLHALTTCSPDLWLRFRAREARDVVLTVLDWWSDAAERIACARPSPTHQTECVTGSGFYRGAFGSPLPKLQ